MKEFLGTLIIGTFVISLVGAAIKYGIDHPLGIWVIIFIVAFVLGAIGSVAGGNDGNKR